MNSKLTDHVQEEEAEHSASSDSIEELKSPRTRQTETLKKLARESDFTGVRN